MSNPKLPSGGPVPGNFPYFSAPTIRRGSDSIFPSSNTGYTKIEGLNAFGEQPYFNLVARDAENNRTEKAIRVTLNRAEGRESTAANGFPLEINKVTGNTISVTLSNEKVTINITRNHNFLALRNALDAVSGITATFVNGADGTEPGVFILGGSDQLVTAFAGAQDPDKWAWVRITADEDGWVHHGTSAPTDHEDSNFYAQYGEYRAVLQPGHELWTVADVPFDLHGSAELWVIDP